MSKTNQRRRELGDFLRSRRSRLSPESVGLPHRPRRGTLGLRRQEVAELAGIGIDWYISIEQGRAGTPSLETLDALAWALRLSEIERSHLRDLVHAADPKPFRLESASPALLNLLNSIAQPAYVTGQRFDLVAWNAAAADLLGFDRLAEEDRNLLVAMLTDPRSHQLFGSSWTHEARRMVARFRAVHDLWAEDVAFDSLRQRLSEACPEFTAWWHDHEIQLPLSGRKILHHSRMGTVTYDYASFQSNDDHGLRLVIFTPVSNVHVRTA